MAGRATGRPGAGRSKGTIRIDSEGILCDFTPFPPQVTTGRPILKALRPALLIIAAASVLLEAGVARAAALQACTARPVSEIQYTSDGMVEISADDGTADLTKNRITFTGEVEVLQDTRRITADRIVYSQDTETIEASGAVSLSQPGLVLRGDQGQVEIQKDYARLTPLGYELPEIGGRGRGSEGESLGDGRFQAKDIDFTTCEPGDDSWYVTAKRLEVDRAAGVATARNAKLKFKQVPLLATPWLRFPIDDRRMSGFLIPEAGYSSRNGFDLRLPYYLNLAPNYDATLYPRLITKRGLLLGGEFRYLFGDHRGDIYAEALPNDRLYEGGNNLRGMVALDHVSNFSDRMRGRLSVNAVSDDTYLEDLGDGLGTSSTVYLNSSANLTYLGDNWEAFANWQYQDVLDDSDKPLSRAPQLVYNTYRPLNGFMDLDFGAEFVNFERTGDASGPRIDFKPAVVMDLHRSWGFFRPRLSARYTSYDLDGVEEDVPTSQDRSLYTISVDSGLFFDRQAGWLGSQGIQTLEPRLFYLYTPYRDQDDIPLFDTAEPELNFPNLFEENRFTGADRVGDANQLTLALSSRYIEDASQRERFSLSIGQTFYFEDRRVQLPRVEPETEKTSPLMGELDLTLSDEWVAAAVVQWDHDEAKVEDSLLRLRYRSDDGRRFVNLGYRYDPESELEYSDIAFATPLSSRYRVVGRWQYSHIDNRTMEALGGLEYDTCCWRLRGAVRHYLSDTETNYDTAFFVQLELKGLTRLGDDLDQILNRAVYGYSLLNN